MVLAVTTGQSVMLARLGKTVVITSLEGPEGSWTGHGYGFYDGAGVLHVFDFDW